MSDPSAQPPLPIPQVDPRQLAEWLASDPDLLLLDVREPYELQLARIDDPRVKLLPVSELVQQGSRALPARQSPEQRMVVFCHVGVRSSQVVAWLKSIGWQQVYDLRGGIEAYARQVDPSVGRY